MIIMLILEFSVMSIKNFFVANFPHKFFTKMQTSLNKRKYNQAYS